MRALGQLSYGIYLWHLIAISMFKEFMDGRELSFGIDPVWGGFVIVILITVLISVISYALVERPFLVLRDRLIGGHGRRAPWLATALVCIGILGLAELFAIVDKVSR